jgi:hypothetical protein
MRERERERERELTGTLTHRSKRRRRRRSRRRRNTPTSPVAPPLLEGRDRGATWGHAMCVLGASRRSHNWRGERKEPRR